MVVRFSNGKHGSSNSVTHELDRACPVPPCQFVGWFSSQRYQGKNNGTIPALSSGPSHHPMPKREFVPHERVLLGVASRASEVWVFAGTTVRKGAWKNREKGAVPGMVRRLGAGWHGPFKALHDVRCMEHPQLVRREDGDDVLGGHRTGIYGLAPWAWEECFPRRSWLDMADWSADLQGVQWEQVSVEND